jgi:hypothetical protein
MSTFFRERVYMYLQRMHGQLDMMDACDDAIGRMKRGIQTVVLVDPASIQWWYDMIDQSIHTQGCLVGELVIVLPRHLPSLLPCCSCCACSDPVQSGRKAAAQIKRPSMTHPSSLAHASVTNRLLLSPSQCFSCQKTKRQLNRCDLKQFFFKNSYFRVI